MDFDLELGGTIRGMVLGIDGLPASGATIQVFTEGGAPLSTWSSVRSNASGRFSYTGVAPGRYSAQARLDGLKSDRVSVRVYSDTDAEVELGLDD